MKYSDTEFNGKIILITGGAGFIGSNLALYFQKNYPESHVVVFDSFRSNSKFENGNLKSLGHFRNLIEFKGDVIYGNINNLNDLDLLNKYKFDFIFHQAAISDTRVDDQEIVIKTNVNSFYNLLEIAKKNNSSLIYASSASTYGNLPSPQKVGEENPDNTYGFSKLMMDQIAMKFIKKNPNMKIIGLRYFNVYGPNEFYKGNTSSMVIQLGLQMLNGRKPKLFTDSSIYFRDFIYIDDVVQANIKAVNSTKSGVFNVGSGSPRSFKEIVDILQNNLNTSFEIDYFENPFKNYQTHTQADLIDTRKYLKFFPEYNLENGIKAYIPEIKLIHKNQQND